MFEVAELGLKLSKQEFDESLPALHTGLLNIQRELLQSAYSVIILISGVEGAGKGTVVNSLNEWLDSRGIQTTAFWDETDEQSMRPRYWRFWRAMPARGNISIMFGSWYTKPIIDRVYGHVDEAEYERELQEIVEFERMLGLGKTIIIKLWFHLSKDKVLENLKADGKDKRVKLRSNPYTAKYSKQFEKFKKASATALRTTDKDNAPWHVIEAGDRHYRDFTAAEIILRTLRETVLPAQQKVAALAAASPAPKSRKKAAQSFPAVLDKVDLSATLDAEKYKASLLKWQRKLNELSWEAHRQRRSVVMVFEGWDAAGKGSTIRRLTQAMDARLYQVISVAAPTDEEAAHHYLWRFWRQLPMAGYFTIYDCSWYGRVLVERVEKLTIEADWKRAYTEINLFEQQLHEHGIIVVKFWLHLSQEEQLRRFKQREETPWKMYKLTEDDWRNRSKWDAYKQAVNEMVAHTSTNQAPWHLINSNDKKYGRIEVLKTLCKTMEKALKV